MVGWGFQFIDAFQGGGGIDVDVPLSGRDFAVAHNLLDDAGPTAILILRFMAHLNYPRN